MKRIDLHIHSNLSDGVLSPIEILDEAQKNNVEIIAIADHDTIEAYDDKFYNYAKSKNIKVINAVEISTTINKVGIHVLGYNFDINNIQLKNKLFKIKNARYEYLNNVSKKLNELGYVLNLNKLNKINSVTKAHIANDIISNPLNKDLLIKNFNYIPSKGEFIETIMNEGCPAYIKKETITPSEATKLIKDAGGIAVLAHPVAYKYEDGLNDNDILNIINSMNADGIESNYIYIDRNNNKINEIEKWNDFAEKNNLITTIGSDFHDKDNIHPEIGLINENLNLDNHTIEKIVNIFCNQNRMNKSELLKLMSTLKIDKKEFWVLSSGALVLREIYETAGDLDIAVTFKGLEQLKKNYNLKEKDNGWFIVSDKIECVCNGDIEHLNYKPEKLKCDYFVQNIFEYLEYLNSSTREKDKKRIPIVKDYINKLK